MYIKRQKLSHVEELAVEGILNKRLSGMEKPDVLGELSIFGLSFGRVPPKVRILDITAPDAKVKYTNTYIT